MKTDPEDEPDFYSLRNTPGHVLFLDLFETLHRLEQLVILETSLKADYMSLLFRSNLPERPV